MPGRRCSSMLLAVSTIVPLALAACVEQPSPYEDLLDECWCHLTTHGGGELLLRCGMSRCVDGHWIACGETGEADDHGACQDDHRQPPPRDGGAGGADGGAPGGDAGACPPGGGHCASNTFYPCAAGEPPRSCRANVCVPSGAGPVAGCLARAGQPCNERACAPGLSCDARQICIEQPDGCRDTCGQAGQRRCASPEQPEECRRLSQAAGGCLAWSALSPCSDGAVCQEGSCASFRAVQEGRFTAGEPCTDPARACVADGTGFSLAGCFL